ncbi:MAG: hypothetical protein GFH27_549289n274 [Chloroflexi bacterium AL-W]|nr:hypothetical protein [Chloroflexi bacterium AL-N1]NOK67006.1 hypothetical protein [Chloroflexi bacterium AL-N10]NOK74702.1 hypothetical protein [Chloroflexi bacterium AL-N5]NOK81608.1 hypothetical protein [Chloroflexi bacterium AL-W]NOK89078.1 hypothetical protein [Chloroflexi bacterium AL-N15]
MRYPLLRYLDQLSIDRWARTGTRAILRAVWLVGCVWCIGIGGHLLWDWPLRYDLLGLISLAVIGIAIITLFRRRMSRQEVARRLDRRFQLHEQLATALEYAHKRPSRESMSEQLLTEASHTTHQVYQRIQRQQNFPWSELLAVIAMALIVLGLYFMAGIGRIDESLIGQRDPLPPLVQPSNVEEFAEEPFASPENQLQDDQSGTPVQNQPNPNADPQTLSALADALRDQGATRPAAEALDRGDLPAAAQELRELADQAGQLSAATRDDLANQLRDAADQIEENNPTLADQLRQSAEGLQRGEQNAAQALEDLARALEELQTPPPEQAQDGGEQGEGGEQVAGQPGQGESEAGQGAGEQAGEGEQEQTGQNGAGSGTGESNSGEQRPAESTGRLGVDGQPLSLEAEGTGQETELSNPDQRASGGISTGFTQGDTSSDQTVEIGNDPLRIPADERNVVQEYFSPQEGE